MTPPPTSDAENATFSRKCYRAITQRGRRGHDRALQSVCDKHQFIGELSVLDFSQQAVLIKAGDADAFHLVMMALPLGPDADVVFRVAGA